MNYNQTLNKMLNNILTHRNKALLTELVRTDFKLRYQGSVLGYAWSLLRPLFMFLILYLVFAVVFKVGESIPNYPIYLLLGIVMWNFFQEMTSQSLSSIVGRGDLIRKIRIPRWMIVVSASVGALINLGLNMIVVMIFVLVSGMDLLATSPLILFFILEVYLFSLGIGLLLSALFVKYRDISYIWDVFLQAGFYATPILYPLALVTSEAMQKVIMLNPMAQAIQGARNVFVTPESITTGDVWRNQWAFFIPLLIVFLTLILGVLYFKSQAKDFAENL
jgi:ABC-2 type transport system permease protein